MAGSNKRKIRNYIINRDLQFRMILTNLIYMLFIVLTTVAVILSPLISDMFISQDLGLQSRAAREFLAVIKRILPVEIILFILISLHQLLITHRILGPIKNFTNTLKSISRGNLTRKVSVRQSDYMGREGEEINHMIEALSHLILRFKNNHDKLVSALKETTRHIEDVDARRNVDEALQIAKRETEFVTEDLALFELDSRFRVKQTAAGMIHIKDLEEKGGMGNV